MQVEQSKEWQPVMQAAVQVAKSRQSIENLIKKNLIEYKKIGDKNVTHVFMPSLLMHYASKKEDASYIANSMKINVNDIKMDLALARAECKRLSDLLAIYEKNLARTESELLKEREKNLSLHHEIMILTKEFKAIINNENGISKIISILRGNKKSF